MTQEQQHDKLDQAAIGSPEWQAEQNKRRSDRFSDLFWRFVEPSSTTAEEKDLVLYLMEQAVEQERAAPLPESGTHTDHPLRHFDRTCPACTQGDTPMTDARWNELYDQGGNTITWFEVAERVRDFARQLERKLASKTRDADHFFQLSGRYLEELNAVQSAIPRSSGAYNWIKDASAALRAVNKAHPLDDKLFAQIQDLLMGVPVPQEDLGFNSPADRAARSTTGAFAPTHKHAEGGHYQQLGYGKMKGGVGSEWEPCVFYTNADGAMFATDLLRWNARFVPISTASATQERK